MQRIMMVFFVALSLFRLQSPAVTASQVVTVTVRNPIDIPRPGETVVLQAAELRRLLSVEDVRRVHIRDERSGQDLLTQAVDTNDDGAFEELVFQADFAPKEIRKFVLSVGVRQVPHP